MIGGNWSPSAGGSARADSGCHCSFDSFLILLVVVDETGLYTSSGAPVPYTQALEITIANAGLELGKDARPLDSALLTINRVPVNDKSVVSKDQTGADFMCPSKNVQKKVRSVSQCSRRLLSPLTTL
jgi:hypothetical protein